MITLLYHSFTIFSIAVTQKIKKIENKKFEKEDKKLLTNKREWYIIKNVFGVMAQLVERLVRNEEASGSNPLSSTIKDLNRTVRFRSFIMQT